MKALYKMTVVEAKMFLREPMAVFFTLAFPVMALLLFGNLFGGYPVPGTDLRGIDLYVPAYTGMIIGTVGLIGLPTTLAAYRDKDVLRRLRATPLTSTTILGAHVLVNLAATTVGIALLLVVGKLAFDLKMPEAPFSVAAALAFASLSFFAVGFAMAGLLPTVRVTSAVGQIVFFPMLFLSGAALPLQTLPNSLRRISDFLPLTYVVELAQGLWIGEGWNWFAVAVLLGVLALSILVSAKTFRWE